MADDQTPESDAAESTEPDAAESAQAPDGEPSEDEIRAQLEAEIRKVKVEDVVLQSLVSILNLAARRIAKDDERDLAQGKLGIDAADGLVGLVPEEAQAQIRQAISELKLLYAQHAGGEPPAAAPGQADGGPAAGQPPGGSPGPGPPKGPGLWTP